MQLVLSCDCFQPACARLDSCDLVQAQYPDINVTMINTCRLGAVKAVFEGCKSAQHIRRVLQAIHKPSSWYKLLYTERRKPITLSNASGPTFQQLTQLR